MCSPFDSVNTGCQHICTKKVSSLSSVFSFPEIKAVENVVRKSFWVSFNPLNINARQSRCLLLLLSSVFFVRASFATLWTNKISEKKIQGENASSMYKVRTIWKNWCCANAVQYILLYWQYLLHTHCMHTQKKTNSLSLKLDGVSLMNGFQTTFLESLLLLF